VKKKSLPIMAFSSKGEEHLKQELLKVPVKRIGTKDSALNPED